MFVFLSVYQRHEHGASLMCFYCLHIETNVADYVKHVQVHDTHARNQLLCNTVVDST